MKRGVPVSPGVAVAPAYCLDTILSRREPTIIDAAAVSVELRRLEQACAAVVQELEHIVHRVVKDVGPRDAAIFRAQQLLLHDPAVMAKLQTAITQRRFDAPSAIRVTLSEYEHLFERIRDDYLRERLSDIRDVFGRLLAQLSHTHRELDSQLEEPVILIAPELLPSQAAAFQKLRVAGIITETGGAMGHAAILARSLGIPAVSGLRGILQEARTGDLVALDGREGCVYLRPGHEVEAAYRKLAREYGNLQEQLITNRDDEAVSADGIRLELLANVNGVDDARAAVRAGASGVGLYRTEYLFLTHPSVPSEEEQLAVYRSVIEAAPNRQVTIRTLDLGGDKQVPYLGQAGEANPFMGWRSIRLSWEHPEFFQTQLRAILRARRFGLVQLLFPMISTVEELRRVKRLVERTRLALKREGLLPPGDVPLGAMIEVPAAALCLDAVLDEVDFVSIGSNDLIQYLMAADRDNPKVAHLCEPFNPALFRLLAHVLKTCQERGKPVTLCGEMAARPRCFLPLFGLGLRRFSMSPAFIPSIKELARHTRSDEAREVAEHVLGMTSMGQIRGYLTRKLKQICPSVAPLDVRG
ncbi:MAG: phosphoenolpyruvate--protein phosphotransferase [Gemmataceae bacterium]|nr:phosphoenolpyruvate--protein phosphotransferase [Gemmataceae bacterium]MDW8266155.1 phosphoenolpyruvate--protein phosphotransferase [Gemmataceae bacterium]